MKHHKILIYLFLIGIFLLSSCINQDTSSNISDEEMSFQGIVVGKTTYDDLQELRLTPLKDIDMNNLRNLIPEPMSGHYIQYNGFEIFVDDTVKSINISKEYSGTLFADLHMGDSLDIVLSKLPQKPKEYEMHSDMMEMPIQLDHNYNAHLISLYDENDLLTDKVIILYSNGKISAQFSFDDDDKIECVTISK